MVRGIWLVRTSSSPGGVALAQLAERLRLDLARPLASDAEGVANDIERARAAVDDAEAQLDHLALARREDIERFAHAGAQQLARRLLLGGGRQEVLQQAAERALILLADGRLE